MTPMNEVRPETPSSPLELRHASTDRPMFVVVPERRLLVIDGAGHPGAADFRMATTVLRTVHEALRATLRRDRFVDEPKSIVEIGWLTEAQWSLDEIIKAFAERETLHWRQMIELPRAATAAAADQAIQETRRQGGRDVTLVRLIAFTEGRAAQVLHLGGMTDLSPTVARLCTFVAESGLRPRGGLHQLVFGDPDIVPPERARSILRMPIE
jgi:hypothetical protein